ncbi:IclR family transcriptional regulator [Lentzea sp. BCCO 10_0798]|uniref:IclR family transcriptional regulator n=1 Tax=Lentzea kristufekii TaxID=3095430 RepID=A0ABU4U1J9_9PSEU|nr:IclR family transcriptional regulator [Lentzea sp. BCCO 10_0798]MDX8054410.1 IclR family transcriptional regulator [Lentzea sp. BCCO 10_0798]
MTAPAGHRDPDARRTAARVLTVLRALTASGGEASCAELGRMTGLPRSTTYRMLAHLREAGLAEIDRGRYRLGGRYLARLGVRPALGQAGRERLVGCLSDLHRATRQVAVLVVPRQCDAEVVDLVHDRRSIGLASALGDHFPLHATAAGKVLLAGGSGRPIPLPGFTPGTITTRPALSRELGLVRATGIAHERQEWQIGLFGVAAPVVGAAGTVVAAIAAMGHVSAFDPDFVGAAVRGASRFASRALSSRRVRD